MAHPARKSRSEGQALVEFALTVPILLMFMFGIIDVARILFALAQTVDASRQAVRYGIVEGMDANGNSTRYLDCAGIRDAALDLPGAIGLNASNVKIYYERADGTVISQCTSGLTTWDIRNDDVLAVRVEGSVRPVTPFLLAITDKISFDYTSRRTIMSEGAPYTPEWPDPPPGAADFNATVNCSKSSNNVSFTWSAMDPIPDRAEIRSSLTGDVIVELDNTAPGLITDAYCNGCATISNADGFGMYYMVAFNGGVSGPPSTDATVACSSTSDPGTVPGSSAISGLVWEDKNGDQMKTSNEKGISGATITLRTAGDDGTLGNSDDQVFEKVTGSDGTYAFTNLTVPNGLSAQVYQVQVSPVSGMSLTTGSSIINITLSASQSYQNANFGFRE